MIQSGFHDTLRAQEKLAKHLLMSLFLLGTQVDYFPASFAVRCGHVTDSSQWEVDGSLIYETLLHSIRHSLSHPVAEWKGFWGH